MLELGFRPINSGCREMDWNKDLDYSLKFYPNYTEKCQHRTHYLFIFCGLALGYLSTLFEMYYHQNNLWLKVLYLLGSVYGVTQFICAKKGEDNKAVLYGEFLGLHFYIMGLVMCIYDFGLTI